MSAEWMRLTVRRKVVEYHVGLVETVEHLGQPMVKLVTAEVPGKPTRWCRYPGRVMIMVAESLTEIASETAYFAPRIVISAEPVSEEDARRVAISNWQHTAQKKYAPRIYYLKGNAMRCYVAEHPDEEVPSHEDLTA